MKLIQAALITLISLGAASAFADDSVADNANGSQFQWQTPSGVMELTPNIMWMQTTEKDKATNSNAKIKDTITTEKVMFGYGINDMFAVSATLGIGNAKSSRTDDSGTSFDDVTGSGMLTPNITFRGRMPMTDSSLRYGISADISVEDAKTKSNGKQNMSNGQTTLTPFVGYEMNLAPDSILGARISYGLNLGDKKLSVDTPQGVVSGTESGGEALAVDVFYEMNVSKVRLGADLGLVSTRTQTLKGNGQSTELHDPLTAMHLGIYAPVTITKSIVILPEITYTKYTAYDTSVTDSIDGFGLDVGARFSF